VLYFTYLRRSRPTCDLSHGWGSNSQWSTDFRRDYAGGGMLHHNVDGVATLSAEGVVVSPLPTSGTSTGAAPARRT